MAETVRLKTSQVTAARAILSKRQDNKCAVCKREFKGKVVGCLDHDHKTGLIRGVLCRACNRLEGQVQNRIVMAGGSASPLSILEGLLDYLTYYADNPSKYVHPTHKTEAEKHAERLAKQRERRKRLKESK